MNTFGVNIEQFMRTSSPKTHLLLARLLLATTISAGLFGSGTFAQQTARILVGPNVLISPERDGASREHLIVADPTNPMNLLATGILLNRANHSKGGAETRGYYSSDGGYSWRTIAFPELAAARSGDPLVAYSRTGTALFVALSILDKKNGMFVWRSEDGGTSWSRPNYVYLVDHPQIVVDHSKGRFAGNVYINAMYSSGDGRRIKNIGMFRSSDDGRSWFGPVSIASTDGIPGAGVNTTTPVVFSDGEVFAPFVSWRDPSEFKKTDGKDGSYTYWFSTSKDGGATFLPPQKLAIREGGNISGAFYNFFAVDNSEWSHRDRLYMAWPDREVKVDPNGRINYTLAGNDGDSHRAGARILFSYSSDRGKTWSNPKAVSPGIMGDQFDLSIAVNNEGTVCVSYYDTRDTPKGRGGVLIDRYISASIDSGETFLPAKRITSVPSDPAILNRNIVGAEVFSLGTVHFNSGFTEYRDYQGIASDLNGVFHPIWADGRTGSNQTWTASIRVERSGKTDKIALGNSSDLIETDVTSMIEIYLDPLREFPQPGSVELPLRLKNKSDKPIYGPVRVEVVPHLPPGASLGSLRTDYWGDRVNLLNADNGVTGLGAVMDYTRSLGDVGSLPPGGITEAVVWRLKTSMSPNDIPNFKIKVTGRIVRSK